MKHPSKQPLRSVPWKGNQSNVIKAPKLAPDAQLEPMDPANDTEKENLLVIKAAGKQHLVLSAQQLKAIGIAHEIVCYADFASHTLKQLDGGHIRDLPKQGVLEFLEGLAAGLNFGKEYPAEEHTEQVKEEEPAEEKPAAISESREHLTPKSVQSAISKAMKYVSRSMDQNIDRWVTEAGSILVADASTNQMVQNQRMLSIAQQLPTSSKDLRKHFQARLLENLQNFNQPKKQADLDLQNLRLAEDKHWDSTAITKLSATVAGEALMNFNQLNRRFSYLLNRRVSPTKNVISPESMAWCLCSALNDMSYSREQAEVVYDVLLEVFSTAMEEIYREVNLLWIEMDILPAIKLRVRHDDYKIRH